jgi:hypothetical protein
VEDTIGSQFQMKVIVADKVQFGEETLEDLLGVISREERHWSRIFPSGVKNLYGKTVLRPRYSALLAEAESFPFKSGPMPIKGWSDVAVFPGSNTAEGRALKFYANTPLAFAIVQFLWAEAGWLDESNGHESADEVAQGIGEMLVKSVRSGSSF